MEASIFAVPSKAVPFSPLMLADRLLTLAQDADRAGFTGAASHLVTAMYKVLDSSKPARH